MNASRNQPSAGATAPAIARPPRPWLVPVAVGAAIGFAATAWWVVLKGAQPCDPSQAVTFGLGVLFVLGMLATVGIAVVIQSQRAARRRIGRALLLVAAAAVPLFLLLTLLLGFFLGPC